MRPGLSLKTDGNCDELWVSSGLRYVSVGPDWKGYNLSSKPPPVIHPSRHLPQPETAQPPSLLQQTNKLRVIPHFQEIDVEYFLLSASPWCFHLIQPSRHLIRPNPLQLELVGLAVTLTLCHQEIELSS